jgi:hypothetical protein
METVPTTAIAEYNPIAAALADLTTRHKGVLFDVTQPTGMKAAKAAAKDIGQYRIALEKKRVELKADVLERGRQIDGEAKRISAQLAVLEDPIVDQIKAEERREEAARQAAILAEQERISAEERARKEAEERKLAEQRAEVARQQAEIDRQRKEQEARDTEMRRKIEDEERAARHRIAEEERLARLAREEEDRKARAARQAEEDRLKAERDRIEGERRAAEEVKRKEREAQEAKARKAQREQNERADARTMLATFKKRFGHRPEFVLVIEAIDECLEAA